MPKLTGVAGKRVAGVTPGVAASTTLYSLVDRLAAALGDVDWRLRLVVDASPGPSVRSAHELAAADERIAVTGLTVAARPAAVLPGLGPEEGGGGWVCLEADRADPPEAVPLLLDRLAHGDVEAVLAVRR